MSRERDEPWWLWLVLDEDDRVSKGAIVAYSLLALAVLLLILSMVLAALGYPIAENS